MSDPPIDRSRAESAAHYDAFVSYSHAQDKPIAATLQAALQTLGKPWYRRRTLRIFRDDTSLSAAPGLWPSIERALAQSRHLILLASPQAAASPWVAKEVAYWLEHKSAETLFIGLTDGDLRWDEVAGDFRRSEAMPLPSIMRGRFAHEPRWIDLRAYRAGATMGDAKFTELAADFAAAIHGLPKEDLLSQEVRQQRRALTLAWSAAGLLFLFAAVAGWQWWDADVAKRVAQAAEGVATEQRDQARQATTRAEQTLEAALRTNGKLINSTWSDYRHSTGIGATTIRNILEGLVQLQVDLTKVGNDSPRLASLGAEALQALVSLNMKLGNLNEARKIAEQVRGRLIELASSQPADASLQIQLATSYGLEADVLSNLRDFDAALVSIRKAQAILKSLVASKSGIPRAALFNVTVISFRIGDMLAERQEFEQAIAAYDEAGIYAEQTLQLFPSDPDAIRNKGAAIQGKCHSLFSVKRFADSIGFCKEALELFERLVSIHPKHTNYLRGLAVSYSSLAKSLNANGDRNAAIVAFRAALTTTKDLAEANPDDAVFQAETAQLEFALGAFDDDKDARWGRALAMYERLKSEGKLWPSHDPFLNFLRKTLKRDHD